jgi:cellulose 1,4-beta-cellobiosidase
VLSLLALGCGGASRESQNSNLYSDFGSAQGQKPPPKYHEPTAVAANPFVGAQFFVNADYAKKVERAADQQSADSAALYRKVAGSPTAIWLDSTARASSVARWLDDAKIQHVRSGQPTLLVFVLYDLPNRDCSAEASAGELNLAQDGETRYRTEFIDPIAAQFRAHPDLSIVAIIEPDALANLATNQSVKKCSKAADAQIRSIAYAVDKLAQKNVSVYLDAAHAGWTGWDASRMQLAQVAKQVLELAGGVDLVRGFATNIANFNTLSGRDGKKLDPSNPCPDELTYVRRLGETLKQVGIRQKGFIIDTSRNGRGGIRQKWSAWCNVRGAGLGERPRAVTNEQPVDAYFWIKPPGESDGVSDPTQPRFDANCRSDDAAANAPQAGEWFREYFIDLVRNADPPI